MAIFISKDNIVLGTIVAVIIFACLFATMGIVIFLYCRGKNRERETALRAKVVLQGKKEVKQRENYQPWTPRQSKPSTTDAGKLGGDGGSALSGSMLSENTPLMITTES